MHAKTSALPTEKLLMRLGVSMGTITALAFIGMLSSVFIAEAMQGAAAAINQAGTLRMQSYRIASHLGHAEKDHADITRTLIQEFDKRLRSTRLTSVISNDPYHDERVSYDTLVAKWRRQVRPVLVAYSVVLKPSFDTSVSRREIEHTLEARESLRARFLDTVDAFVSDIDRFVGLLELKTETKIRLLRFIQVVWLFLTLGVVIFTMYLMYTHILLPLRELLTSAQRARRGDFSVRIQHTSDDELGQLGAAFNLMAEDLSKMYADLEQRVQAKTIDLERSNRSLELLYEAAMRLNQKPLDRETYQQLLSELDSTLGMDFSNICLTSEDGTRFFKFATSRIPNGASPDLCEISECDTCLTVSGDGHNFFVHDRCGTPLATHSFPIRDKDRQYGVLITNLSNGRDLHEWQKRLLEALASQIGTAITVARRAEQSHRVALLEERNVIARELHDSLAQSLSYMKIQTSRLAATLDARDRIEHSKKILEELREGVTSAYRQLRELLNTFRLSMEGHGLASAINNAIVEFRERGDIPIELCYDIQGCLLSPNEEIHILQVTREAVSNAVRHANAKQIKVIVAYSQATHGLRLAVEDDGIGLPESPERTHHHGFAIMDERAHSLGGTLRYQNIPSGGTRIELQFTPQSARRSDVAPEPGNQVHEQS